MKKAFTLLELLLVIIVLGILIRASKDLFKNPYQYINDGEVCINEVSGELHRFFYNGITGKTQYNQSGIVISTFPKSYFIDISFQNNRDGIEPNSIILSVDDNTDSGTIVKDLTRSHIDDNTSRHNAGIDCNDSKILIYLSDGKTINTSSEYSIRINKQSNTTQTGGPTIEICTGVGTCTDRVFTLDINYWICPKDSGKACVRSYIDRFETTTQTLKSNRCLGYHRSTGECSARSAGSGFTFIE